MSDPTPRVDQIKAEAEKFLEKVDFFFHPEEQKEERLSVQEAYHPQHFLSDEQRLQENLQKAEELKTKNEIIRKEIRSIQITIQKLQREKEKYQGYLHSSTERRFKMATHRPLM